jgi:hypothetical protein
MPSTYSPSLRIELIGEGEQDGIWGQTTNNNLGELIEQAITGVTDVDVAAGNVTLTSFNGTVDEARSAVLAVTGSPGTTRIITVPNAAKMYTVRNRTDSTVQVKTVSGVAFNCPTLSESYIYCDGSNVITGSSITDGANVITSTSLPFTSPAFLGTPTAPTAAVTTNTTQIATTAFVNAEIANDAPTKTGGGASGTWAISISGSAASLATGNNYQVNSLGVGTAASGTAGEIRATNNVTAFYSSDRQFKENVQPVQNALDKVQAIGTKTFDWTDEYIAKNGGEDGYFVQKNDFGVIAQDVQAVFPEAVRVRPDGSLAVDYEKLGTLAFQAIIELTERVKALEVK